MKRSNLIILVVLLVAGAAQAGDPNSGWTAWAMVGTNPEAGKSQELRVGYEGLLPGVELALGGLHLDAPDPAVDEWSGRAYLIAHAFDAQLLAQLLGTTIPLPPGNLYGGLFGQYVYDRADAVSGGYLVGGLVDWPQRWQLVAEYAVNLWNNDNNAYSFAVGVRKKF